ncbi:protein phosphatase PTC7 homolog [Nilaparvata lugens]|uniref:protein phosphatase PTC7 homolog n=1 Tax=Nilaparvata lugens TaxID=108931 RepID=UPI00193E19A6|nr:protein phosphatase PTC7 homolog [Nilaparvata lugens]
MQSIVWTGRLISRALLSGLPNYSTCADTNVSRKREPQFLSAVCGFPKEFANARIKKGQFGDDAWFTAKFKTADVLGVADGVGGWRNYGIDPGEFSAFLMQTCERLVTSGRFSPHEPASMLARSYYELLENKKSILGSSTACVVVFTHTLPAQHASPGHSASVLSDRPDSADTCNFPVEEGDVILVATDGVFDNVPDQLLLTELSRVQGERDPVKIQHVANSIAWMARSLAFDDKFMSPFAISAQANGIHTVGGKPDDITVLLATVAF